MTEHEDLIAEVLEAHVPREVIFGYPVEPGEGVEEGYVETCMCGEKYPCDAVRLVNALEKVTAERDRLDEAFDRWLDRVKSEARESVVTPEAREHWEWTQKSRQAHGDRGCVCALCGVMERVYERGESNV